MDYQETVHWLFAQLPMYQQQGAIAYKADLHNTLLLAEYLGNPEKKLRCIHVAGTNGKGSTSHLLASVLQEAGYKVGLYTSPHLKDFRERIKINGNCIEENYVTAFVAQHQTFFEQNDLSFFEMTVGLALQYFADNNVEVAIIEVGMGGRLDATNIITPLLSVITNIGLDHTAFLGNTLTAIAGEKAGIIKANTPVIIGQHTPETRAVFLEKAASQNALLCFADESTEKPPACALLGNYQKHNTKTALTAIRVLQNHDYFTIPERVISEGFLNVVTNTGLQGRWQQLGANPKIIADTAHNYDGLAEVMNQIQEEKFTQLHLVIGVVNDKDLDGILPLFPKNGQYYFCKPDLPRGLDAEILAAKAAEFQLFGKVYNSVSAAYVAARKNAAITDFIYVGGSTFVVAEIL
jgi:dihydrofolate synthase/folylpolyglutamate synthase